MSALKNRTWIAVLSVITNASILFAIEKNLSTLALPIWYWLSIGISFPLFIRATKRVPSAFFASFTLSISVLLAGINFVANQNHLNLVDYTRAIVSSNVDQLLTIPDHPIKKWIEEGADFGTWKGAEAKADAKTEGKQEKKADDDQKKSEDKKKGESKDKDAGKGGLSMLDAGLPMLGEEQIAAVRAHFSVEPAAADTSLLRVTAFGRESSVDDAAIAALSNASGHIAELVLARTQTTDAAMAAIASMPRLVHLDLRGTKVTDDGVIALAGATQLRSLNLYGTSVGDRGIAALSACKNLEQLYVCETPVSAAAVVTLNASLPSARIVFAADLPQPMADADQGNARARRR